MKNYSLFCLFVTVIFSSCQEKKNSVELPKNTIQKEVIQLTNKDVNSEGVFLFTSKEEQLISWTEHGENKKETSLKLAFLNPITNAFEQPIIITPAKGLQLHAESMAKVGITKKGVLYAVFRVKSKNSKSMYGGTVYYTTSTNKGGTWSEKQQLVADTTGTSQSYFDIAQLANGTLGISWLDNRKLHKDRQGQTLYFAKTDPTNTFQNKTALEGSVCQCCRTDIEVGNNGTIQIAFRNLIAPTESGFPSILADKSTEVRDMYSTSSIDNGATFSKASSIYADNWQVNGCPHTGPSLATNTNESGAVWFTDTETNSGIFFKTNTSSNKKLISKTGSHPQMVAANSNYYIVYEEYYEVNKKGYTKIVMQEWNASSMLKTTEISVKKTNNDHAVIKAINSSQLVISWINTDIKNAVIQYVIYDL
ncbi:MAG: hypothetical protein COA88_00060 [Kordia sp.]|nr:MAG: hypothetical protein COA88_00060 [Kordia sp.]